MKDELIPLRARFVEGWPETIACGPGWTPLLAELDAALSQIKPDYRVLQVKEKFGGLRFYVEDYGTDNREEFASLIRDAEAKSFRTCEECGGAGENGRARGSGWWRTLCAECAPEGWKPYGDDD